MAERTPMVKVDGYWRELPAGDTTAGASGGSSGVRTVVASSDATVSPTAADSGKTYRCTNGSATFTLPTTGLETGINYWVVFSDAGEGAFDAGSGNVVEHLQQDGTFSGVADQTSTGWFNNQMIYIEYTAANTWSASGFNHL